MLYKYCVLLNNNFRLIFKVNLIIYYKQFLNRHYNPFIRKKHFPSKMYFLADILFCGVIICQTNCIVILNCIYKIRLLQILSAHTQGRTI